MKDVEFFNWWLPPSTPRGKPYVSRFKMTREEAAKRYPGSEPYLPSREVRVLAENESELNLQQMRFLDNRPK